MTATTRLLFVYGTLLSTATSKMGLPQRQSLMRESIGGCRAATVAGRLYDLGRYPGLICSDVSGDIVHGEILELIEPERTLRWLDAYEGIAPCEHPHNEYERCVRSVAVTAAAETVTAWVYVYRQDVSRARPIPDGRWI